MQVFLPAQLCQVRPHLCCKADRTLGTQRIAFPSKASLWRQAFSPPSWASEGSVRASYTLCALFGVHPHPLASSTLNGVPPFPTWCSDPWPPAPRGHMWTWGFWLSYHLDFNFFSLLFFCTWRHPFLSILPHLKICAYILCSISTAYVKEGPSDLFGPLSPRRAIEPRLCLGIAFWSFLPPVCLWACLPSQAALGLTPWPFHLCVPGAWHNAGKTLVKWENETERERGNWMCVSLRVVNERCYVTCERVRCEDLVSRYRHSYLAVGPTKGSGGKNCKRPNSKPWKHCIALKLRLHPKSATPPWVDPTRTLFSNVTGSWHWRHTEEPSPGSCLFW